MKMKQIAISLLMPLIKIYWRIFKPKTYGVKVLIRHPDNPEKVLLVRHSYGNKTLWNIPGGGYKPKKETPEEAAVREVREELNIALENPQIIGLYETDGEGKRDTVTIVSGAIKTVDITRNNEIAEILWKESSAAVHDVNVSKVTKKAIRLAYPEKN
jgi:8-oxo-dGTP pyrophosphatase MutT (NUDIX family)